MLVAYLSHPLGGENLQDEGDNFARACAWFRFLINVTTWAITSPGMLYATALGGTLNGPRRLVDQLTCLERCDIVLLCGGWISPHMHQEISRAHRVGVPVLDLTMMGVAPPEPDDDVAMLIVHRAGKAIKGRPRRVWVPMLTLSDVEAMKQARAALFRMGPKDHPTAVSLLDRIIDAALDS